MTEVCITTPQAASPDMGIATYMTIAQAAKILRRKTWAIYEAVHNGDLPAFQPGGEGTYLIRPDDLERYVLAGRIEAVA